VEQKIKTIFMKGFFVFFIGFGFASCVTPRHTVEVGDYLLLDNGKEILGKEKGLTCFFFENNQRKQPIQQFLTYKYNVGSTENISYDIILEKTKFKVFLYTNDELVKYYDLSQFMVSNVETEVNRLGSTANFIGMSVIDEYNNDCLADGSLYQSIVLKYLKELKFEYNNY
jgi:hypothetical protein